MSVTAQPYRSALATNSTSTGFTSKTSTATKPTGTGVFDLLGTTLSVSAGGYVPRFVELLPFGKDGNNDTFDMRLWGWSRWVDSTLTYPATVWIPKLLMELNVVLGNITLTGIGTGNYQSDTLTIADGDSTSPIISPASDTGASILVHMRGCELIEFDWDLAGAQESVSMNCLFKFMDQ
jgi:hypothetical protein